MLVRTMAIAAVVSALMIGSPQAQDSGPQCGTLADGLKAAKSRYNEEPVLILKRKDGVRIIITESPMPKETWTLFAVNGPGKDAKACVMADDGGSDAQSEQN